MPRPWLGTTLGLTASDEKAYYTRDLHPLWRLFVLDSLEVSVAGHTPEHPDVVQAPSSFRMSLALTLAFTLCAGGGPCEAPQ